MHLKTIDGSKEGNWLEGNNGQLVINENVELKSVLMKPIQLDRALVQLEIKNTLKNYQTHGITLGSIICLVVLYKCGILNLIRNLFVKFRLRTGETSNLEENKQNGELATVEEASEDKKKSVTLKTVLKRKEEKNPKGPNCSGSNSNKLTSDKLDLKIFL